jgi:signal transduction histidine kinase
MLLPHITTARIAALLLALALATIPAPAAPPPARGLPLTRSYSFHDIGHVPRGSRLSFDQHGRVAVVNEGVYTVLNDATWLSYVTPDTDPILMTTVGVGPDGRSYYGAPGSFGRAELRSDGKLHPTPFAREVPGWVRAAVFEDMVFLRDSVVFTSRGGLAHWNFTAQSAQLVELPKVSRIFSLGNAVYASRFDLPLQRVDLVNHRLEPCPETILDQVAVEFAIDLGDQALVSLLDDRMFLFDGAKATPWAGQEHPELVGQISSLKRLADGNVAVALVGRGVFILSPAGELLWSLSTPQFHRVSSMASNEPGVLWLVTEHSIDMVWYGGGLTTFDQRLGLPLSWPVLAVWNDRIFVASDGVLFEGITAGPGHSTFFHRVVPQPPGGAWALSADGTHLLVGSVSGIYSMSPEGRYDHVGQVSDLAYLVMVDGKTCFAISPTECAMFEWNDGVWRESAPRVAGLPGASIVHSIGKSAWIERGPLGVARLAKKDGKIAVMHLPNEGWTDQRWVNVGSVHDTVVLSASRHLRRFYDEVTETWCERPELATLLSRSPHFLARVRSDTLGNIWAAHFQGVVRFTPKGDGTYDEAPIHFEMINDRYPRVHVLPDNDIWLSASQSLCHIEASTVLPKRTAGVPILVGMTDTRNNVELLAAGASPRQRLNFAQNSLAFRFFAGKYTAYGPPHYEYRLNGGDSWSQLETGSVLRFPDLQEGAYNLEVRVGGPRSALNPSLTLPFTVAPPWHRTLPAYCLFGAIALSATIGAVRWSTGLTRRRNRMLEELVRERTAALEAAMQKLNEETRVTATLAERDRVAGEIHDSVQQGLTGAILQLETTMKLPTLSSDLHNRLGVVRNMVSYARQEVQHAVWDVESPLLEGNDLSAALEKLKTYVASSELTPEVRISGQAPALSRQVTHHLLRIAQEAATNALRHARASCVVIHLEYLPDAIRLSVSDDGQGFDPSLVLSRSGHFGLRGLRTRARKLGAELQIDSTPGRGTTISVVLSRSRVSRSE